MMGKHVKNVASKTAIDASMIFKATENNNIL